jgi:hypothetical protein
MAPPQVSVTSPSVWMVLENAVTVTQALNASMYWRNDEALLTLKQNSILKYVSVLLLGLDCVKYSKLFVMVLLDFVIPVEHHSACAFGIPSTVCDSPNRNPGRFAMRAVMMSSFFPRDSKFASCTATFSSPQIELTKHKVYSFFLYIPMPIIKRLLRTAETGLDKLRGQLSDPDQPADDELDDHDDDNFVYNDSKKEVRTTGFDPIGFIRFREPCSWPKIP